MQPTLKYSWTDKVKIIVNYKATRSVYSLTIYRIFDFRMFMETTRLTSKYLAVDFKEQRGAGLGRE